MILCCHSCTVGVKKSSRGFLSSSFVSVSLMTILIEANSASSEYGNQHLISQLWKVAEVGTHYRSVGWTTHFRQKIEAGRRNSRPRSRVAHKPSSELGSEGLLRKSPSVLALRIQKGYCSGLLPPFCACPLVCTVRGTSPRNQIKKWTNQRPNWPIPATCPLLCTLRIVIPATQSCIKFLQPASCKPYKGHVSIDLKWVQVTKAKHENQITKPVSQPEPVTSLVQLEKLQHSQ